MCVCARACVFLGGLGWDAAYVLAEHLLQPQLPTTGLHCAEPPSAGCTFPAASAGRRTVVELGCGLGTAGLALALAPADVHGPVEVFLTDMGKVVNLCRRNVELNQLLQHGHTEASAHGRYHFGHAAAAQTAWAQSSSAHVSELCWGRASAERWATENLESQGADLIIAADVVVPLFYSTQALLETICVLANERSLVLSLSLSRSLSLSLSVCVCVCVCPGRAQNNRYSAVARPPTKHPCSPLALRLSSAVSLCLLRVPRLPRVCLTCVVGSRGRLATCQSLRRCSLCWAALSRKFCFVICTRTSTILAIPSAGDHSVSLREAVKVAEFCRKGQGDVQHWSTMSRWGHWRQRIGVEIVRGLARIVERAATGGGSSAGIQHSLTTRGCRGGR